MSAWILTWLVLGYFSNVCPSFLAYVCMLRVGGAERLVVDAALGLQQRGHTVEIHTSHHDPAHCFDETKDGMLSLSIISYTYTDL
jgi:hypothetical protein